MIPLHWLVLLHSILLGRLVPIHLSHLSHLCLCLHWWSCSMCPLWLSRSLLSYCYTHCHHPHPLLPGYRTLCPYLLLRPTRIKCPALYLPALVVPAGQAAPANSIHPCRHRMLPLPAWSCLSALTSRSSRSSGTGAFGLTLVAVVGYILIYSSMSLSSPPPPYYPSWGLIHLAGCPLWPPAALNYSLLHWS